MGQSISKGEYALLVISAAERRSGAGNQPSPQNINDAQTEVNAAIARKGVVVRGGADSVNALFGKAKAKAASSRARAISGFCCGRTEMPASSEDLALLKAMRAWHGAEHARNATSTSGSFWGSLKNAAVSAASVIPGVFSNQNVRKALPFVAASLPIAAIATPLLIKALSDQKKRQAGASAPAPVQEEQQTSPIAAPNTEESDAATAAGGAEVGAAKRRGPPYYFPPFITVGAQIPHEIYRAAVMQHAQRLAGRGTPSTTEMFRAERLVQNGLARRGVQVAIPGARPGRRTV
jgi:hypothetical protein